MKAILFGSWRNVLSFMMSFLLFIPGCGNLYKLKTSDLHQLKSKEESTHVSQEFSKESLYKTGSLSQNDSSNFWVWFESSHPFVFHPDKGLEAQKGNLIIRGSRLQSNLVEENSLQLNNSKKGTFDFENLEMAEKNLTKAIEKERKAGDWLWFWLLGGGLLLWLVLRKLNGK